MIDPYRMIVVNLIAVFILLFGIFFCRYIFPKKKINLFYLLICISILPVISIFRTGIYESGDFIYHIYHSMDFYDALREGILIPSWAAGLNSGFGHPVFLFIYILPYYLISFSHFFGFTFIFSEKLVLAGSLILSGIAMWFALKKLTKNDLASFSGSILYIFAPYHLVDLHFRVAIAESIAFAITPIIFYLILKTKDKFKFLYLAWLSLLFGILFFDHPAMFVIYSALFLIFVLFETIFKKTEKRVLITFLISLFLGMLICSFGWITRILLTPLTEGSSLINTPVSFVHLPELLFSTWRLGFLFQGPYGQLSYVIGYGGLTILLLSLFFLFRKRGGKDKHYKDVLFWTIISLLTIFIMLPASKVFWDTFKFLSLMQFAYRFLHIMAFCIAILTGYMMLFYQKKQTLIFIFLALCIGYTILNWGNRKTIPGINDTWIRHNLPNGTKQGEKMIEATPLWWNTKEDFLTPAKAPIEIISGDAKIKSLERRTTEHTYIINAANKTILVENTLYFPNWKIKVNGIETNTNYKNPGYNARMVFSVPKGLSFIDVKYSDIKEVRIAKIISIVVSASLVIYLILYYTSQIMKFISLNFLKKDKKRKA